MRRLLVPFLFALGLLVTPLHAFDRIDGATATQDRKFTEGNRYSNPIIPATVVKSVWLNGVQEEIATVITGAGLTLNAADNTQLKTAIDSNVSAHANLTAPHSASAAATPNRLALRDANGKLAGDILGNANNITTSATTTDAGKVELATTVETSAGADASRAVTPAGLKVELDKKAPLASPVFSGIPTAPTAVSGTNTSQIATTAFARGAASQTVNGYQVLPSGLIMQWGYSPGTASSRTVTFPIPFPTACLNIVGTVYTTPVQLQMVSFRDVTTTTFGLNTGDHTGAGQPNPVNWFAIGY